MRKGAPPQADELEMQVVVLGALVGRASMQSERHPVLWASGAQVSSAPRVFSAGPCWAVIKLHSPGPGLTWLHRPP